MMHAGCIGMAIAHYGPSGQVSYKPVVQSICTQDEIICHELVKSFSTHKKNECPNIFTK